MEFDCEELIEPVMHNGLPYQFRLTVKGIRDRGLTEEERLLTPINLAFVWSNSNIGYEKKTDKEVVARVIQKRGDWSRKPRSKKRRFANR